MISRDVLSFGFIRSTDKINDLSVAVSFSVRTKTTPPDSGSEPFFSYLELYAECSSPLLSLKVK